MQQYNNLELNIDQFIVFLENNNLSDPITFPIPTNFEKLTSGLQKKEKVNVLTKYNWFKNKDGSDTAEYTESMPQIRDDAQGNTVLDKLYEHEYKKQFSIKPSQTGGEPTEDQTISQLLTNALGNNQYGNTDIKKTLKTLNTLNAFNKFQNEQYRQQYIQKSDKWSYYVRVELELYPGESIPLEDYSSLICQFRYEKIRQIWAELFGTQYAPGIFTKPSDYKSKNKTAKNNTDKNNTNQNAAEPATEQQPIATSRIA